MTKFFGHGYLLNFTFNTIKFHNRWQARVQTAKIFKTIFYIAKGTSIITQSRRTKRSLQKMNSGYQVEREKLSRNLFSKLKAI